MQTLYRTHLLSLAFVALGIAGCGGGGGGQSGSGGTSSAPPTLEFSASPQDVITGHSSVLTWTSSNATSCSATGDWTGSRAVNGSETITGLTKDATYSLTCKGRGGTVQRIASVVVFPPPDPPSVRAAFGDRSITVSFAGQAGSGYAGFAVTTNVYVSTSPTIDVSNFKESPSNQVMRGLNIMLPVVFRGLTNGTPVYIVATDVADGVQSAPSNEVSVTPQPVPPLVENIVALNDTGVDGCTDLTNLELPCPFAALPNQDADQGRDAAARNGQLVKTGFGPAGFDFTKLDASGSPLPNDAPTWPCIRDNVTGLIWEVPTDSGLTAANNSYTWYQPDPLRNGGEAGQPDGGSCTGSACDTDAFIRALNAAGHCGFHDWRLPTHRELFSLADLSRSNPAMVTSAFPNLPYALITYYWSSVTNSESAGVGFVAWAMDVSTGMMLVKPKWLLWPGDYPGYILAVRADSIP